MRTHGFGVLLATMVIAATTSTAWAGSTYTVTGLGDPTPVGTCSGTVCPSLRAAVAQAKTDPGSTIQLGAGTYTLGRGAGLATGAGHLHVDPAAGLTIAGAGSGVTTIEQTDGLHRVLLIDGNGSVLLSGVTITGGTLTGADGAADSGTTGGDASGAGIDTAGTVAITLQDVAIFDNTATGGHGGSASSGFAGSGGAAVAGLYASSSAALTISHSSISTNIATGGTGGNGTAGLDGSQGGSAWGGMLVLNSPLTIQASTLTTNVAMGGTGGTGTGSGNHGGAGAIATSALEVDAASVTIADSAIVGNISNGGSGGAGHTNANGGSGLATLGAAAHFNAIATIRGTTISGNVADAGGGGSGTTGGAGGSYFGTLYMGLDGDVVNSTIAGNSLTGGNGGTPGGTDGNGFGGGFYASTTLTLASDTLSANRATTGSGAGGDAGNLDVSATLTMGDTIVTGGLGSSTTSNCNVHAITDLGHNLEGDTLTQCKLSAAKGDLVGVDPLLGALGANGGPTMTEALGAGSPALGAGGSCTDPSIPGTPPLAVDQRGLPRATPCSIGAFEPQVPANTVLPVITGGSLAGQTLSCANGTWAGDGTLTYAQQWLIDGVAIPGAVGATYVVQANEAGLGLNCQVTATNIYGARTAASAAVIATVPPPPPPPPPPPVTASVGSVKESASSWREGSKLASISRATKKKTKKAPVGTTFSFTLNTAATVTLTFTHETTGRKVGKHCVAQTKSNARKHSCPRTVTDGKLSLKGAAGARRVRFQGRLSSHKKLSLGSHTVTFTAKGANGKTSKSKTLHFKIVRS